MKITKSELRKIIEEELKAEGKICDAGISYVLRTDAGNKGKDIHRGSDGKIKNWSARAAQIASKKCKDPSYGTGKSKKNEELEEAEGGLKAWEKEEWVHSDGRPCGSGEKDGSKSRCKPKSKWKTMSKKEKEADNAKKAKGTKAGRQYVPATKKGKVTKAHTKREGLTMNNNLRQIVKEELQRTLFKPGLMHHVENRIPVTENIYRAGSPCFFNVIKQARMHYKSGLYEALNDEERDLLENSDLGEWAIVEGKRVPLDFPMYISEALTKTEIDFDEWFSIVQHSLREDGFDPKREEKGAHQSYLSGYTPDEYEEEWLASKGLLEAKKKKDPPLNKPMRNSGGGKKYKVYVRDPKSGNVRTITYGDAKGGLKGGWNSAAARKSFAARHNCEQKKDKTKAGYWACRAHKDFGPGVGRFW